jgi:hypothetical protein
MPSHERFEELCVLAAAGEISAADKGELIAHMKDCRGCRSTLEDMKQIHATWLPGREGFEVERSAAVESNLRQLILERATTEGAHFSAEAQSPELPVLRAPWSQYGRFLGPVLSAAAVFLVMLAGVGIAGRMNLLHWVSKSSLAARNDVDTAEVLGVSEFDAMRAKAREAQANQEKVENALQKAQADRERLEHQLAEAERLVSGLEQSSSAATQEVANLKQQVDAARANESKAEYDFAALRSLTSDKDSQLIAAEEENGELRAKLDAQTAAIGREKDLMADGREIRDLIAARNLHIIDVYDTNGEGRTQKSFGRVFYTEGKSLVFYAYDLPARRPEAKYAFYAWGKRDASEQGVRNLGIFYSDDQTQKRWVLNVTDPQVLSEIDSVFVTLEPSENPDTRPSGRKLLSAYLGTPANHP